MSKLAITVVDDDPAVLRALSRLLRAHGMTVTTFGSGNEFLESIRSGEPDCVILDVQMPDMSGFEVCNKVRSLGCATPVIFVTAHEDLKAEQLAGSTGAAAFLYKPVRADILRNAIRTALQQNHTRPSS